MIRAIVITLVLFVATVVGLSIYLQPNDLSMCGKTPTGSAPCTSVDAIVAISGGDTDARTDQAIHLYQEGWASTIIFSGAAQDKSGPSNAAAMRLRALSAGIPSSSILLDENSDTTQQNAKNTDTIFDGHNIHSVILVTSGYHQQRASLEFHKMAPGITILNDPVLSDQDWSFWWWLTPRGWWLAGSETVKIIAFYFGFD